MFKFTLAEVDRIGVYFLPQSDLVLTQVYGFEQGHYLKYPSSPKAYVALNRWCWARRWAGFAPSLALWDCVGEFGLGLDRPASRDPIRNCHQVYCWINLARLTWSAGSELEGYWWSSYDLKRETQSWYISERRPPEWYLSNCGPSWLFLANLRQLEIL